LRPRLETTLEFSYIHLNTLQRNEYLNTYIIKKLIITNKEKSGRTQILLSSIFTEFGQKKNQEKFSINIERPRVKTNQNSSL
jgi:hypothetical protein